MGTRSVIGIRATDGSVRHIYCHWDGYPAHNGKILLHHYDDLRRVELLIALGNLSCLRKELGVFAHDFNDHSLDVCTAYGRDRGDVDQEAQTSASLYEVPRQEYLYIFDVKTNCWWWAHGTADVRLLEIGDCE